jgi:hypothetical protein
MAGCAQGLGRRHPRGAKAMGQATSGVMAGNEGDAIEALDE